MSQYAISVENVSKYFGKFKAVSSVNFKVDQGEIFGFLGPNGAGKTTCIKMMLDLLRPDQGQIKVFGKEVIQYAVEIRKLIGFLPGNFTNFDNMSGLEYLKFAANQRQIDFQNPQDLFDIFELSNTDLNKKMKSMSHGMLQKIGIIQAVFHKPDLLILDEPTTGLDPLMQDVFYNLIKELHHEGRTIFFSSHNLGEVERICHNIAVIRTGEIVALETIDNLKKKVLRKLTVILKQKVNNLSISGAELISSDDFKHDFLVTGNVENLLKDLNALPVEDMVFPEPGLDEVFISYYNKDKSNILK